MTDISSAYVAKAKTLSGRLRLAAAAIGLSALRTRAAPDQPVALSAFDRCALEEMSSLGPISSASVFPFSKPAATVASFSGLNGAMALPKSQYEDLLSRKLITASGYLTAKARLSLASED